MTERLILVLLFFFSALCLRGQVIQSIECGNLIDAHSEARRNELGTTVVLQMHAEDDHEKDFHLCMSNYSFSVRRADGTSVRRDITSDDDSYGRSIKFWIDGFTDGGQRVIATITDSNYSIINYDLRTGEISVMDIAQSFLNRLGEVCRNTLAVSGVTRDGHVVLSIGGGACDFAKRKWKVKPGIVLKGIQQRATIERLPDTTVIEPVQ